LMGSTALCAYDCALTPFGSACLVHVSATGNYFWSPNPAAALSTWEMSTHLNTNST
jgi:hypothetical protein